MGITNQQIVDRLDTAIEAMERVVSQQAAHSAKQHELNEAHHAAFRIAMQESLTSLVVMQKIVERHERNWGNVWKVGIVPVLVGFVGGIWLLITNAGG